MATSIAPWTDEQVEKLREWQKCPWVHPFTCGNGCGAAQEDRVLVPTNAGWVCPICNNWDQDWCFTSMLDGPPPDPMGGW